VLGSSQSGSALAPTTELLLRTLKKPQHFYEAAQILGGMDKLSKASRAMFRKASKALAKSDKALRLASEQAGPLRMEDMMFEFHV